MVSHRGGTPPYSASSRSSGPSIELKKRKRQGVPKKGRRPFFGKLFNLPPNHGLKQGEYRGVMRWDEYLCNVRKMGRGPVLDFSERVPCDQDSIGCQGGCHLGQGDDDFAHE